MSLLQWVLLCYDIRMRIVGITAEYNPFHNGHAWLFAQLRQMTEEGAKRPDFLFDIPHIKRGAVVLTDAGRRALAQAE